MSDIETQHPVKPDDTFLQGKITVPLIKFTIPLALALIVQALYGAVDMIIVGHLGSTADVSAVGIGSLIMQALTAVITGLSMGITVRLGHCIGAGALHKAAQTVGGMVKLAGIGAALATVPMVLLATTAARVMATPEESFAATVAYVQICSVGIVFITAYNAIAGVFRGLGDSKSPLLFVLIACGLNVIGDLFFVGGLKMGAAGAAYATVISQAVSVFFCIYYIRKNRLPFRFTWKHIVHSGDAVKRILRIGIPVASQDLLNYLSFMILAAIVNSLGLLASAAMGIEGKVFAFFVLVPISFMSALSAFVAQNIGARQEERALKALKRCMLIAFAMGVASFSLAFFGGEFLAGLFEKNPEAVWAASRLLKGAAFEHLLYPFIFCLLGYFNGKALTTFVVIQGAVCAFLVRVPLAYLLSKNGNEDLLWVGLALSASALLSLVLCVWYFHRQKNPRRFSLIECLNRFKPAASAGESL